MNNVKFRFQINPLCTGEGSQDKNPQSCTARPQVVNNREYPLHGVPVVLGYNTECLAMGHSG